MKVGMLQPLGRANHVVIKQQSDCAKEIGFARSIFADDSVDTLLEQQLRVGKVPVVDQAELGYMHLIQSCC